MFCLVGLSYVNATGRLSKEKVIAQMVPAAGFDVFSSQ